MHSKSHRCTHTDTHPHIHETVTDSINILFISVKKKKIISLFKVLVEKQKNLLKLSFLRDSNQNSAIIICLSPFVKVSKLFESNHLFQKILSVCVL